MKRYSDVMAAILKLLRQIKTFGFTMRIYLKIIPAEFHPDPIWNDGALGSLKRSPLQEEEQDE